VQKVMVEILNAIYEQDFLDCSYGFRPGQGAHQALDEVGRVICTRPTGWILELDITSYFDTIVREQLIEMIEKRISDDSVLRLIRKWIQAGVIEEGRLLRSETGTGQGQPISPILANIYLHYILDEWFEEVVKPRMKGEAHEIRFADDAILCFEHKGDAEKVAQSPRPFRWGRDKAVGAYNGGPRNPNPHYAAGVGAVAAYARNILERVTAANEQAATDTLEL
jgi:RNA-directed DNA polymerase